MLTFECSKDRGYPRHHCVLIPLKDESTCEHFTERANGSATWVYTKDLKSHGRIPGIVIPPMIDAFGGETKIRAAGYRKHWMLFENPATGKYTFGNQYSFSHGGPYERKRAAHMLEVDFSELT